MIKKGISNYFNMLTKQQVLSITQLDYESINDLYELKTVQNSYIGKFMRRKPFNLWEKDRFIRSKLIMEICSNSNIPVPYCIYASNHTFNYYHAYMFMTKCDGVRLSDLWTKLNSNQKLDLARNLGVVIKNIHSIKFNELRFLKQYSYSKDKYWKSQINFELKLMKDRLLESKYLNIDLVLKAVDYVSNNQNLFNIEPSLIHLDISNVNTLVDPETLNITCILDWEWSFLADPVYDLTNLDELFDNDSSSIEIFLKSYGINQDEDFNIRKRIYTVYQQLQTSAIGYYFHNPYPEAVAGIENKINTNI